jgi:uncharacterized membrane protein
MGKINFGRVLFAGFVAGVFLDIGEFLLNGVVLGNQMKDYFSRHNFPQPGNSFMVIAILITLVLGIAMVFVYAMIRPRFGPGPKTAVIAALTVWFLVFLYNNVIGAALGFVPVNMFAIAFGWELVEYLLAALLGAALYREA